MVHNLKLDIEHCIALYKIGYRAAESQSMHCGKWKSNAALESEAAIHLMSLLNEDLEHEAKENEQQKLTLIIPLRKEDVIHATKEKEGPYPNAS